MEMNVCELILNLKHQYPKELKKEIEKLKNEEEKDNHWLS